MSVFQGINDRFQKDLQAEIDAADKTMILGNFASMEEYKRIVGKRQGLLFALERHKHLISLMESKD